MRGAAAHSNVWPGGDLHIAGPCAATTHAAVKCVEPIKSSRMRAGSGQEHGNGRCRARRRRATWHGRLAARTATRARSVKFGRRPPRRRRPTTTRPGARGRTLVCGSSWTASRRRAFRCLAMLRSPWRARTASCHQQATNHASGPAGACRPSPCRCSLRPLHRRCRTTRVTLAGPRVRATTAETALATLNRRGRSRTTRTRP